MLNGLTNLVVNAFLVRDNAAACVVVAFILDHKSRASLGPNARCIVVACISLVLAAILGIHTATSTTTLAVFPFSSFLFVLFYLRKSVYWLPVGKS